MHPVARTILFVLAVALCAPARAATDIDFGRYHALVIGINAYKNLPQLETAVNDASVPSMTQDSQTLDYVRFSGYENTSMHMAVSRGSGAIGTADRGPEHAAEGGLALADRASVGGGMRHHGDHAAHRDIKADGVALAGALPGGRGRWPVARQEPAAGDAAAERRHQDAGG